MSLANLWRRARSIDYHERNAWAIVWVAINGHDEAVVYREYNPSPLKLVTDQIAERVVRMSGYERYIMNLIDPLANKIQPNTGLTTVHDLNEVFMRLKREGLGTGGWWEVYDTKGQKGRDEIRKRLRNAKDCECPGNNRRIIRGKEIYIPTLWVAGCPEVSKSLKQWRFEEWPSGRSMVSKDRKESPSQKFSHFCTAIEGVFKDERFRKPIRLKRKKIRQTDFKVR